MQPNGPSSGSRGRVARSGVCGHSYEARRVGERGAPLHSRRFRAGQARWCPGRRGPSGRWCSRSQDRRRTYSRRSGTSRVHRGEWWLVPPQQHRPPSGGRGASVRSASASRDCLSVSGVGVQVRAGDVSLLVLRSLGEPSAPFDPS